MTSKNNTQAVIAAGQSVSSIIQLPPCDRIAAIMVPAGWTAADIGFLVSVDGVNFQPLYWGTTGAVYSVKAAAGKTSLLGSFDFQSFPYLQLTSLAVGTANAANQASNMALTITIDDLA